MSAKNKRKRRTENKHEDRANVGSKQDMWFFLTKMCDNIIFEAVS